MQRWWGKAGLVGAALALIGGQVMAQAPNTYAFATGTTGPNSTLATLTAPTSLVGASSDDGASALTNIGFTFNFGGNNYTQFGASANGAIRLGAVTTTASTYYTNSLANANTGSPLIMAYWDDLATGTGGSVRSELQGTAPNRRLVIEWFVTVPRNTSGAANARFQCWLDETTNVITFVHGTGTLANTANGGYSIGINLATSQYTSVNGATHVSSTSTFTTNATAAIAAGRWYQFTPPVACTSLPSLTGGTASATVTSGCGSVATSTLSVTGASGGASGFTYQWRSGPVGGPYTTNLGTALTQVVTSVTSTTAYVRDIICTGGPATATSSEVVITVNPTVTAGVSASPAGPFCGAASTALTATGGLTYAWSPATGLDAVTGATVNSTTTSTRTYTVTATGVGGCTGTANVTVTVNPLPLVISTTATPNPVCNGGNSNLNVAVGGTSTVIGSGLTVNDGNATPYPSTIAVSGITGTIIDLRVNITNLTHTWPNDVDMVLFGPTGAHSVIFTDAIGSSGGIVGRNYTFANGASALPTTGFPASGTYGVVNGGGYTGSGTPSPVTNTGLGAFNGTNPNGTWSLFVFDDTGGDIGTIGSWSLEISTGAPVASYSWSPITYLNDPTLPNPTATSVVTTENYTVTVTATNGCTATGTVSLVPSAPITAASITGTLSYCTGGSTTLTAVPADGGAPYTYLWSPGGETTASIAVNAVGSYSCQVSDNCAGSVNTGSVSVTENPLPTVTANPPSAGRCADDAPLALTAGGASTYTWAPATGLSATTGTSVNANPTATTTYTVTGTDGNGCQNTATATVNYNGFRPTISATTATPATICEDATSQLQVTAGNTTNYSVASTPFAEVTPTGTPTALVIDQVNQSTGNFTGSLDDGFWTGIPVSFPFEFYGQGVTNMAIGTNGTVMFGTATTHWPTATPDANPIPDVDGPQGFISGMWIDHNFGTGVTNRLDYFTEGTAPSRKMVIRFRATIFGSSDKDSCQVILYEGSNMIDVMVRATPSTSEKTIGVENFAGTAAVAAPGRNASVASIPANEGWRFMPNGTAGLTYSWAPAGDLDNAAINNPISSVNTTTTYTATVDNGSGCTAQGTALLTVNPLPTLTCPSNSSTCVNDAAFALAGSGENPTGGTFSGTGVSGGNFDPAAAGVGTHTITYSYTDGNTCTNTCTFDITVNGLPTVTCPANSNACINAAAFVLTGGNPTGGTYSGTGVSGGTFDPAVAGVGTHTITYSYTDGNSCTNTCQFTITVDPDADGDGLCDPQDNCPNTPGQNGDACDAGPNFVLGQIVDCACVGQVCTTDLVLEVKTDGNGSQTTWELRQQGTNTLVQSGGGTYPNNVTLTDNTCLPNGCYYLRVLDGGGDGILNGGGYILRTLNGAQRIIDNRGNFSSGSVSAVIGNGGFCLPLGTDKLIFTSCDKLDWVNNQFIVAAENPAVTAEFGVSNTTSGYQFWWFDPNGTYGYSKFRSHATSDGFGSGATRACHARINNWSPAQIPANVLMNVKVRGRVNGNNLPWGPVCRFMIDPVRAACPFTKLVDIPGNVNFSCGVTRTWGGSSLSKVVAKAVDGATQYQFRWNNAELAAPVIRTTTTPVLQLNWNPALDNGTYQVQVRAFKNGVWCVTSLPWGDECNVTITGSPNAMVIGGGSTTSTGDAKLAMFPNPNNGEQLTVSLSAVEEGVETISVDIFDLSGARVSSRTIAVNDGMVYQVLELTEMASGLYMVNITAGNDRYTERLVIAK
jgi:subtilisin-like proprotein convertase family protein